MKVDRGSDKKLRSVKKSLFARYGLDSSANTTTELLKAMAASDRAIDANLSLSSERAGESVETYSIFQVEALLDQAADLLDRGIKLRGEWDELRTKRFLVDADLVEFFQLDEIHRQEELAGYYLLESKLSAAALAAEDKTATVFANAARQLREFITANYTDATITRFVKIASVQAFSGAYPLFAKDVQVGGEWQYVFKDEEPGVKEAKCVREARYAREFKYHDLYTTKASLNAQLDTFDAASAAAKLRVEKGLLPKKQFDELDIGFRMRRTGVKRNLAAQKLASTANPGGALNYCERLDPIEERFRRDFTYALRRLAKAAEGLKSLFGYTVPLPNSTLKLLGGGKSDGGFNDALLWVRDAINWMVGFSRLDAQSVHTVSLRAMSESEWQRGKERKSWSFELAKTFLDRGRVSLRNLRLRGIDAFVSAADRSKTWQIAIEAPKDSVVWHSSGSENPVVQNVPPLWAGRVSVRDFPRNPDTAGADLFHNLSPIGRWGIQVVAGSGRGDDISALEDVQLDLHLVSRAAVQAPQPLRRARR